MKLPCYGNKKQDLCTEFVDRIYADLKFACSQSAIPSLHEKRIEILPCFGGGELAMKNFSRERFRSFVKFLIECEDERDLWKAYKESTGSTDRKEFLASMNFFMSSAAVYHGYFDDFSNAIIKKGLEDNLKTSSEIFENYMKHKLMKARLDKLYEDETNKGIVWSIGSKKVQEMNRHDFMAAFLACHYKGDGEDFAVGIPRLLGTAYESLDYVSHLRKGYTFEKANENFDRDTARYEKSAAWGYKFCTQKD